MLGRTITHEKYLRLFAQGMGCLTVGAAGVVVGIQGPAGTISTMSLAMSIPFLLTGLIIIMMPTVIPVIEEPYIEMAEPEPEPEQAPGLQTMGPAPFPSDD